MKLFASLAICSIALTLTCCCPSAEYMASKEKALADQQSLSEVVEASPLIEGETYQPIYENRFMSSKASPLSSFAIDVDGASYSNCRRILSQGILPPPDAVRVEEFINYFTYHYPEPADNEPFKIYSEYSDCPWAKGHQLLQIGLKGKELNLQEAPDNNLVFLIDVSGSMADENKLPLLKRAFALLVKQLREQDRISMVVYAGNAGVVLDGAHGDDQDEILEALEKLQAGGSTAGGEGIELAYKLAQDHFIKKGNNRIILTTDGDFNVGPASQAELEKLIEEKRTQGIYLSVIGFGEGNIRDNIMETLADKGNGNYNYIDNFMEARKVLVNQFSGTLFTIAKDVKIQIEFNPSQVKEYRLIGYENRVMNAEDFNDDQKDAGELGAGHTVTALYEIIPIGSPEHQTQVDDLKYHTASPEKNTELATVKFRYKGVLKQDTTSKLISHSISAVPVNTAQQSVHFKLASGIAEFGMLLRGSHYKANANFEQALALVSSAKQQDPEGYIAGLIDLINITKDLQPAPPIKE